MKRCWLLIICVFFLPSTVYCQQGEDTWGRLTSDDQFIRYYQPEGYRLVVRFDEKTSTAIDVPVGMYLEIKGLLSKNPELAEYFSKIKNGKHVDDIDLLLTAGEYPQTIKGDIQLRLKSKSEAGADKIEMPTGMDSAPFALDLKEVILVIEKRGS